MQSVCILFENSGLVYNMGGLFACSIQGTLLAETQQLSLTTGTMGRMVAVPTSCITFA